MKVRQVQLEISESELARRAAQGAILLAIVVLVVAYLRLSSIEDEE